MTTLICGFLDLSGVKDSIEREKLLARSATAMNFGNLDADVKFFSHGPISISRISLFPEHQPPCNLPEISQNEQTAICGDFRTYYTNSDSLAECDQLSSTEAENALTAFEDGLQGVSSLEGDFACAHWKKNRKELTLARDHMGVRPLVYSHRKGDYFVFASLPAGLIAMGVSLEINDSFLFQSLTNRFNGELEIKNIHLLPAGNILQVSGDTNPKLRAYWSLDQSSVWDPNNDFDSAAEELARLIDDAVAARLRTTDRTASHLSSGLDSSAVTVFAKRFLEKSNRRLLSATMRDNFFHPKIMKRGELQGVQSLIQTAGGIDHVQVDVPPADPKQRSGKLFAGTTIANENAFGEGAIASVLRSRQASVVLTGLGGDQFVSGSGQAAVVELLFKGRFLRLAKVLQGLKQARGWSPIRVIAYAIFRDLAPPKLSNLLNPSIPNSLKSIAPFKSFVSQSLWKQIRDAQISTPMTERDRRVADWKSGDIQLQLLELAHIGAANGVHYTAPLLDPRVVSFAHALPVEFYARDGHNRAIMRAALQDVVPDHIRFKAHKVGASIAPITKLSQNKASYLSLIDDLILEPGSQQFGVDLNAVRKAIERVPDTEEAVEMDATGSIDTAYVAALHLLELVEKMSKLTRSGGKYV